MGKDGEDKMRMRQYYPLGERALRSENGESSRLVYELVVDERQTGNLYGLCARKLPGSECELLPGLSYSRAEVEGLAERFLRCEVTPLVLAETVDDFIR